MRRLIWGFAGRTYHIVGDPMTWLIYFLPMQELQAIANAHFGSAESQPQPDETETQEQPRADDVDDEERDDPSDLRTDERVRDFLRQAEQGDEGNLQFYTRLK